MLAVTEAGFSWVAGHARGDDDEEENMAACHASCPGRPVTITP